jgi:hypothetical protein
MHEELTPALCPDDGVAIVQLWNEWKPAGATAWQTDVITDSVRILPSSDCAHQVSVCRDCLDTWRIDYIVSLAPEGTPRPEMTDD